MDDEKKKPGLALVIGESKAKGDGDDATTEEDETTEDSTEAAGEVFDMLVSKDREGFIQAMKAFKAC